MAPVNVIKSSEAKELLRGEPVYEELLKVLNSCMIIDGRNSMSKIMYKDFNYLVVVASKMNSINEYLCPGLFDTSFILSPIHIAGDEAILGKIPIGGVISPCNINNIKETVEEFNRSSIYTHVIKTVIILDEIMPPKSILTSEMDIIDIHVACRKYKGTITPDIINSIVDNGDVIDDIGNIPQLIQPNIFMIIIKERGLELTHNCLYTLGSPDSLRVLYMDSNSKVHISSILVTVLKYSETEDALLNTIKEFNYKYEPIKIIDIIRLW